MARIGFVGLGNMGGGMARNLVGAGHEVVAFDLAEAALDRAVAAGCGRGGDAARATADADAVVTMLPAGAHVAAVYRGLFATMRAGTLLIDCSTIDVAMARTIAAEAHAAGFAMVDAPVSGGIMAADAGTLTFMVGGSAAAFAAAEPILAVMGKAVIHAGEAGAGQAAKICNNLMLGAQMVSTCEALALACGWGSIRSVSMRLHPGRRGRAGRSPPIARCRGWGRRARPTAATRADSPPR